MANTTTTTSVLNNLVPDYYVPRALITLDSEAKLKEFASKTPLPEGRGKTVIWNAWRNMAAASSTLSEGGSNDVPALSSRKVSASIAQYGKGLLLTDLATLVTALDSMDGAEKMLSRAQAKTVERVIQMGIFKNNIADNQTSTFLSAYMSAVASAFSADTGTISTSNKQFQFPAVFGTSASRLSAVSKTAPTTSAQLSVFSIRKATQVLRRKDALPLADGMFVGYTHPNAIHSVKRDPTWADWNKYQNSKETMYKGEVGQVDQVRFLASTLSPRYAVAAHSVLTCFIFGQEAFGLTELDGAIEMNVITGADKSDIYNTKSYLSFKYTGAAACLNPSAGVILFVHEKI